MPFFHIIAPQIPADRKDEFLAAWPTMSADIKAQPGVAGVSAGTVVAEDGAAATEFKFVQCIGKYLDVRQGTSMVRANET